MNVHELLENAGSIFASLVTAYVHKVDEKDEGADQMYVGFAIPDSEFGKLTRDEFETLYLRPALIALSKEFNRYGVVRIQTLPPSLSPGSVTITLEPIPLRVTVSYGYHDKEQFMGHKFYIDTMMLGIENAIPVSS